MRWLTFLRMKRGLTQKALAAALGTDPTVLCRIERGWMAKPPARVEANLRRFFGPEWTFKRLMEPVPDFASKPDGHCNCHDDAA